MVLNLTIPCYNRIPLEQKLWLLKNYVGETFEAEPIKISVINLVIENSQYKKLVGFLIFLIV